MALKVAKLHGPLNGAAAVILVLVLGYLAWEQAKGDGSYPANGWDTLWTVLLFAIPCFIQISVAVHTYIANKNGEPFSYGSVVSIFITALPYLIAWRLYISGIFWVSISYVLLAVIVVLLILLVRATYFLVHYDRFSTDLRDRTESSPEREESWAIAYFKGLRQMHFCALMQYFAAFLSIAYLAGFALAFHDKANGNSDMQMDPTNNVNYSSGAVTAPNSEQSTRHAAACLYFDAAIDGNRNGAQIIGPNSSSEKTQSAEKNAQKPLEALNNEAITRIKELLENVPKETRSRQKLNFSLTGRTDPSPPPPRVFPDNYVLSKTRIYAARNHLSAQVTEMGFGADQINWDEKPLSSFQEGNGCAGITGDKLVSQRVVEVSVDVPPITPATQPLKLIDYMYFSIYTITTTGYGDIKPVAAFSKFMCSFENMIEVFFMVIFLNVLIAFKDSSTAKSITAIQEDIEVIKEELNLKNKELTKTEASTLDPKEVVTQEERTYILQRVWDFVRGVNKEDGEANKAEGEKPPK